MKQDHQSYRDEDHVVWSLMFNRQQEVLANRATTTFLDGIGKVGFEPTRIPVFEEVNKRLRKLTGWQIYEVPGIVADDEFFKLLSQKQFPATTWIRKMKDLEYIEEPDMFHDVYGHIPILANQAFCDFLQGLANISLKHINDEFAILLMSRIYWFTVEFGLIEENGNLKIYGAGLLSSIGESQYSLESEIPERESFNIDLILSEPFIKEKYQVKYFIIHSYQQLFESLEEVETMLNERLGQRQG